MPSEDRAASVNNIPWFSLKDNFPDYYYNPPWLLVTPQLEVSKGEKKKWGTFLSFHSFNLLSLCEACQMLTFKRKPSLLLPHRGMFYTFWQLTVFLPLTCSLTLFILWLNNNADTSCDYLSVLQKLQYHSTWEAYSPQKFENKIQQIANEAMQWIASLRSSSI